MLDGPRVIDPDAVGEADLLDGLPDQTVLRILGPGLGQLQLVEDAESHVSPLC